jgi:hypothetical protein
MRTARLSLAAALLLAVAPGAPATAQPVSKDARPAARAAAVDPTGTYDWSIEADGQTYRGTLTVTKVNDTTYAAAVTHETQAGEVKAKAVKLTGDHLVVVSDTQYGDLTMDVKIGEKLEATWTVGDGSHNGAMQIARKKP